MGIEKEVIGLDFDGCIAYGANAKIRFAREKWGFELAVGQTAEDTFPHSHQRYREMMDVVGRRIDEYELAPDCREVLEGLLQKGFSLAVVTSRADYELGAARYFITKHKLPIPATDVHNTNRGGKKAVCQQLGAAAFLEDSLWKLVELQGTGIALYFMNQQWNVHEQHAASQHEFIVTVNGWQHFYSHVTGADLATARVINNA